VSLLALAVMGSNTLPPLLSRSDRVSSYLAHSNSSSNDSAKGETNGSGDSLIPPPASVSAPDGLIFQNPSTDHIPFTLLLGPAPGFPPTDSHNAAATGGCLNIVTHIKDGFLDEAEPNAAKSYLHMLALVLQELTTVTVTKDHNYQPPESNKCNIPTCEGCYNQYDNDAIPCISATNTVAFPRLLALRSQEPNEMYPFNFGVRLRKTPITAGMFCVLCAVCCVLCAVCCVLCAMCCVLCAVCCVLCAVSCVLCPVS